MTHKLQSNYTKEILTLLKKVLGPTTDFSIWGCGKGTENPREFDLEGQWDLITELLQDWWNRNSWRAQRKSCVHKDPGEKSSDLTRDLARLVCECFQSLVEMWVHSGLPPGQGHWLQQSWEVLHTDICPFGGGHHYPYIVLPQTKLQGGNTVPPISRKSD